MNEIAIWIENLGAIGTIFGFLVSYILGVLSNRYLVLLRHRLKSEGDYQRQCRGDFVKGGADIVIDALSGLSASAWTRSSALSVFLRLGERPVSMAVWRLQPFLTPESQAAIEEGVRVGVEMARAGTAEDGVSQGNMEMKEKLLALRRELEATKQRMERFSAQQWREFLGSN